MKRKNPPGQKTDIKKEKGQCDKAFQPLNISFRACSRVWFKRKREERERFIGGLPCSLVLLFRRKGIWGFN